MSAAASEPAGEWNVEKKYRGKQKRWSFEEETG
jgi:hypothetical protein